MTDTQASLRRMVDGVLRPLFEADGAYIELISVDEDEVVLRLGGESCRGPAQAVVCEGVVEPAVKKVVGDAVRIRYVLQSKTAAE